MTAEEIDAIVREAKGTSDRWGDVTYSTADLKHVANRVNGIMQERLNQQSIQLAEKDAKIYAYETIIANSNFKAVLPRAKGGEK